MTLAKSRTTAKRVPRSWARMTEKAYGKASPSEFYAGARKKVSSLMSGLQADHSGEKGDRAVSYRQKDHWAFLDILAILDARIDVAIDILKQIDDRVTALEQAASEATKMAYLGVFKVGETYAPGNFVTHAGSLWHCNEATQERPGHGTKEWTLAVKRGRDGKEVGNGD